MRTLLILLALILLVVWWWQRRRGDRPSGATSRQPAQHGSSAASEYHAVAIKTQPYACAAAQRLEGKRYLATDAPRLPLADCDRERCECRFQHYKDRRSGRDRRSPFGSGGMAARTGNFEQERRLPDGRRADDK